MIPKQPLAEMSQAERFAREEPMAQAALDTLSAEEQGMLAYDWLFWARPKQLAPAGEWSTWIIRAGRGFGKTRSATGWVQQRALKQRRWIAMIAKNPADARDYMVEGPGGLLDKAGKNVPLHERANFEPSKRRLTWPNGSWATIFSDEEPDQLRGFSGDTAWIDELGKFDHPREVMDNLAFGMREASSDRPRKLLTLTPQVAGQANQLLRELEALPGTRVVRGTSYENRANLDPAWFKETLTVYEGTEKGREEIYGELLDPEEQGIIKRSWFKLWPAARPLPKFETVILSLDTAFTEVAYDKNTHRPDPTAGTVWGLFVLPGQPKPRPDRPVQMGIMLLDCWEEHLGFPDLIERVRREMKIAYGLADMALIRPLVGRPIGEDQGRRPDLLLIEDKGSGISLRQTLARENIFAVPYNPGHADKLQRLHMISHVFSHGLVWLVESETRPGQPKTWTEPLLRQLCAFSGEGSLQHDDLMDSATQALRVMLDKHLVRVTGPDPDTLEDIHSSYISPYGRPLLKPQANPYGV